MPSPHRRNKRFRRTERPSSPLRLTPRDLELLRLVAEHRFLSSMHLARLLGGSRQNLLRRLQRLYHHGYLERPRAQLDYYHRTGSRPMAYGLARRGAGRLRRDLDLPFDRMEWAGRPKAVGRVFLDHTLLVADVMIALELACRKRGDVQLILLDGLLPDPQSPGRRRPNRWQVTIPSRQRIGVVPDRAFALEYPDTREGLTRAYFFLEADRGTMPIVRSNLRQSSFQRKLMAYESTWTQGLHQKHLGIHRFRVLSVIDSPERARHLREACQKLHRGRGLFLFLDAATVRGSNDLLAERWQSASNPAPLLP